LCYLFSSNNLDIDTLSALANAANSISATGLC
jgi:hypothetical protein